jgi:hypothetical protein
VALSTKTITGQWLSPSQDALGVVPARGKVIFTLTNPITDPLGNVVVSPLPVTANLDLDGSITVVLYVTDDLGLNQPQTYYRVTEDIEGASRRTYNVEISSTLASPTDLSDIAPFSASPDLSSGSLATSLTAHVNASIGVHGIADTAQLETQSGAQAKATAAQLSAKAYADSLVGVGNQARPGNTFVFTQGTPSASWTVTHNLNSYPSVSVVDSAGNVVEGAIQYLSSAALIVTFSSAFSGAAYLN